MCSVPRRCFSRVYPNGTLGAWSPWPDPLQAEMMGRSRYVYTICLEAGGKRIYKKAMRYEWDPGKAASNLDKHGVPFDAIHAFEWPTAVGGRDPGDHGENRFRAYGLIGGRLHQCVYTWRGRCLPTDQPAQGQQPRDHEV